MFGKGEIINRSPFLEWIDIEKVGIDKLSMLCRSLSYMKTRKDINRKLACANPALIDILGNDIDPVYLSTNYNAVSLFPKYIDGLNWSYVSENKNAISFLKEHHDKIDHTALMKNPNGMDLLDLKEIDIDQLCLYPHAINIIKKNISL